MAEVISIQGTTATAKIRNPFIAFLLVFVTLGIYYLVWYYKINRELRDLGRAAGQEEQLGRSPFTSLMAITFGWLILVPPFVSTYRTLQAHPQGAGDQRHRRRTDQRLARVPPLSGRGLHSPRRDPLCPERTQPPLAHNTGAPGG